MLFKTHSPRAIFRRWRLLTPFLAFLAAGSLTVALWDQVFQHSPFVLFSFAIAVSAWMVGWQAGVAVGVAGILVLAGKRHFSPKVIPSSCLMLVGTCVVSFFITTRKRLDATRREAERRYQAVFDASRDGQIIYTCEGRIVDANPAACDMYGLSRDEIVGVEASSAIHADGTQFFEDFLKVLLTGRDFHRETVDRRRDGTRFPIEIRGSTISYGGRTHLMAVIRDTSERRRADAALREGERRLRSLVEQSAAGIAQTDLVGRIRFANDRYCQIVGHSAEELSRLRVHDLTHPDDLADTTRLVAEGAATGREYAMEKRYVRKDGAIVWVVVSASVIKDEAGNPESIMGVVIDVTDRKRAEEGLRQSRERADFLSRAIDDSSQPFASGHLDGSLMLVNPAFAALTGYSEAELRSISWATDLTPPRWRACEHEVLAELHRTGRPQLYEKEYIRKNGAIVPIEIKVHLARDAAGNPSYYYAFVADISDRKRAERDLRESQERFTAFMNNSPTASWITDVEGRIEYVSDTYSRTFALPTADLIGKRPCDLFPPEFARRHVANIEAVAESGRATEVEETAQRVDGSVGEFLVYKFPLRRESGRTLVGCVAVDVTDRKRAERDREKLLAAESAARAEAERASRMKDEFLATLSHELRTPLNAMLGWSQVLKGGDLHAEDLRQGLETIERNARVQTQIIEDLLDMSRIISGKMRMDVQPIDLDPVLRAAVDTVKPAAAAKRVRLVMEIDSPAGPVGGDSGRLQQVFWNLLSNAVKFTPRDGQVRVVLKRDDSHLEVRVIDTGEGISPEFLPNVFDRFTQADASTTRRHGGLGLGLAIVKHLLELHGGSVRVESEGRGRGTTFVVSLPLMTEGLEIENEVDRIHAPSQPSRVEPAKRGDLAGVKVLLVDDEPDARSLVKRVLEDRGAVVTAAASVDEALERFRASPPDVLLSDIGMPGEDGYSLIARLRALHPDEGRDAPAVALTAYARPEDRLRALGAGFQTHVAKPVEPEELIATISSLVGDR